MSQNIKELKVKAQKTRLKVLNMIASASKGHIGGAFSCVEILTTLFHGRILRFDPQNPSWPERDRFILSKGHSCEALYVILADLGFFSRQEIERYQKEGCRLGGHPDRKIPGIEADTGSLGHGLGIGAGLALSAKLDQKDFLTFVLMGDGECCEGSVWEAAMFACKHKLDNLVAVVDHNGLCVTDFLEDCTAMKPLKAKWEAFGWDVTEVDGHAMKKLLSLFQKARNRKTGKPLMIIARTIKGKGVSFMENKTEWHHGVPKGELLERARQELS